MKSYTILISIVAALGGLLFGFDTAVIAGSLQYLKPVFSLSDAEVGLVVAAASIGCIPGALFAGSLADQFGRKKLMIVTSILYIIAALGSGIAGSYVQLVVYRFIGGVAIGMASTLAPIYISEVAPPKFRGRLGMLQQLAIVTGILLSFISNYVIAKAPFGFLNDGNIWRYMLAAAVVPSVIFFILLLLVPESPRWLIAKNKIKDAQRVFDHIYSKTESVEQVELVSKDIATEDTSALKEVFTPRFRKVVIIGLVFASIAQLTGINIVFYYAPLIFEKVHVGGSVLFQTMLTGVVNLIFTILAFPLIDRLGRKKLLLVGSVIMGLCMFVLAALFHFDMLHNYFVLLTIFVYIGGFACTWGVVLWVYVAEIFPNRVRGTATSIAVFGNWVANSIVSLTFPVMLAQLGPVYTFGVYGIINISMVLFVSRYVFETKGVPLERIEELYAKV
ncbi:sugar porter family MFS transporter [Mucilaginibacter sp. SG564]|uniref:sugar porter family MFS transporter n=1 Tax=unclassified Mucilaginibacter TaxID=2617802 RepID=UPI0015573F01|nr:sugar porter family MFS transporter [Mucilaginibacter sp. SG564]NOW95305.1 sugar porter (SP) family MFS transporter [Mucilaginibacter sp. SG564]